MAKTITAFVAATCLSAAFTGTALAQSTSDRPVEGQATALAAGAAVAQVNPDKDRARKQGTLYDRVGGIFAIAAVVIVGAIALSIDTNDTRVTAVARFGRIAFLAG